MTSEDLSSSQREQCKLLIIYGSLYVATSLQNGCSPAELLMGRLIPSTAETRGARWREERREVTELDKEEF